MWAKWVIQGQELTVIELTVIEQVTADAQGCKATVPADPGFNVDASCSARHRGVMPALHGSQCKHRYVATRAWQDDL